VVADDVGVLDDLLGAEVAQVDHGHARVGLVVDEDPLAVVVAVGLAQRRVMGVAHANLDAIDVAGIQDLLGGDIADAVALPGFGREDGDILEDAHGGHADHDQVARVAARGEEIVLIPLPLGM
jgi:hypothetical protein